MYVLATASAFFVATMIAPTPVPEDKRPVPIMEVITPALHHAVLGRGQSGLLDHQQTCPTTSSIVVCGHRIEKNMNVASGYVPDGSVSPGVIPRHIQALRAPIERCGVTGGQGHGCTGGLTMLMTDPGSAKLVVAPLRFMQD